MTNYDAFAKTFAKSRKNLKWEEIEYFREKYLQNIENKNILDIGCGSGRLLEHLPNNSNFFYTGVDNSLEMTLEAKKSHPDREFIVGEMNNFKVENTFDFVLFIASFHHLNTIEKRIETLENLKNYINKDSIILLTNWKLDSEIYSGKYENGIIPNSTNEFQSIDYSVKIGEFNRFYHCFTITELEYLFEKTCFKIIENRLFDNQKNIISVIKLKN